MNSDLFNDINKSVRNTPIGELPAGATERRYEPEGGVKKHNERIHRESKYIDDHGNLPFTFSKPKKQVRNKYVACSNCGHITRAQKNTVGIICSECKTYSSVEEVSM